MKFGNFLWCITFGWISGVITFVLGVVFAVTIIGIPFAKQFFKISKLCFLPFGKAVDTEFDAHPIGNFLYLIFGLGFFEALLSYILGIVFAVTLIGIPFAKQFFKIGKLCWAPFGGRVFK